VIIQIFHLNYDFQNLRILGLKTDLVYDVSQALRLSISDAILNTISLSLQRLCFSEAILAYYFGEV
jgi:hypothetical protein